MATKPEKWNRKWMQSLCNQSLRVLLLILEKEKPGKVTGILLEWWRSIWERGKAGYNSDRGLCVTFMKQVEVQESKGG